MPKVNRVTQPSVDAPALTGGYQNINIPANSFGQQEGAALFNLGQAVSRGAEDVGNAYLRMKARKDASDATAAVTDYDKASFDANEKAKQDPSLDAATFADDTFAQNEKNIQAAAKGMSKNAARQYEQRANVLNLRQYKANVSFANRKILVDGRANSEAAIANIISQEATRISNGDVSNFDLMQESRDAVLEEVNIAYKNNFYPDRNPEDLAKEKLRELDLAYANALITRNPSALIDMLDPKNNHLLFLTTSDKNAKLAQAHSSRKSLDERQKFSKFLADISKHQEFHKRILQHDPNLTITEVENSGLSDFAKDYWIEEFSGSMEGKVRELVETGKNQEEAKRRLGRKKKAKKIVYSAEAKAIYSAQLIDEFLVLANIKDREEYEDLSDKEIAEKLSGIEDLNNILTLTQKALQFHRDNKIVKSQRDFILNELAPSLTDMIDSKYWNGTAKKDSFIGRANTVYGTNPALAPAFYILDKLLNNPRERNIYADYYNSALETLQTKFPAANNVDGRVFVMSSVARHIKIATTLEGQEQVDYVRNIGRNAVIDIMYELDPTTKDIPYDEYYEAVGVRAEAEDGVVEYGLRPDGTEKGNGFLGELKMRDGSGRVSTEQSINVDIDGKDTLIPLIVSTTTEEDLNILLSDVELKDIPKPIIDKAITHAKKRIKKGQSPFKENNDSPGGAVSAPSAAIEDMRGLLDNQEARKFFASSFSNGAEILESLDNEAIK